jgi:putative transposase
MMARTTSRRAFRILNIINEYTRECFACLVGRKLKAEMSSMSSSNLFVFSNIPEYIRFDIGMEYTAMAIRGWLDRLGVKTLFIEPGSPGRTVTSSHSTAN